jgi:trk system potassium uptake protein
MNKMANILAFWSFLVLFFAPVIGYYTDFHRIEYLTAIANLLMLLLTIVSNTFYGERREQQRVIIFDIIMLLMGILLILYQAKYVILFLLIRQSYFIIQWLLFRFRKGSLNKFLYKNPPVAMMLSFASVILSGAVLLTLPIASRSNTITPFIDTLFTATSATCVTGLTVLDTGSHFSIFGQIIILILIQVGGLGIMTISTFFALVLGQNINIKLKNVMNQMVGGSSRVNILELLKNIVLVTVIIESLGAVILLFRFIQDFKPVKAIYLSVFHSVSAFCNAGFSNFQDNLMGYCNSPIVSLTIPILIILGGLGFMVIIDVNRYVWHKDKIRKLTLHTKIVLATTSILIIGGFIAFFVMEYHGTMQGFSIYKRFLASFFQSVTTRTAGFNTIDNGSLSKAAVLVSIVLMFIGASPGSTGGGIKTSTFAILGLSVLSLLRGRKEISVFKRNIPRDNFKEAAGLTFLSAGIVFFVIIMLMLVESHRFDQIVFEAVSAFGTVGLSMGITPHLTFFGKLLITLLMYIGRIGPLTMIYAFAVHKKHANISFAEETIAIG